jgi:hypothetical protein
VTLPTNVLFVWLTPQLKGAEPSNDLTHNLERFFGLYETDSQFKDEYLTDTKDPL